MAGKKLIEMVCKGNHGRSPVAELIVRNHLTSSGAIFDYDAISSGTTVSLIESGNYSASTMIPIIYLGIGRNLYQPSEVREIEQVIRKEDVGVLKKYFLQAVGTFCPEEDMWRREALFHLGISGTLKKGRDQTVVRSDVVAVFSMDQKNNGLVEKMYEPSDRKPIIDVLSKFATRDPNAQVVNAFGRTRDMYMRGIQQLVDEAPLAVDRIIHA